MRMKIDPITTGDVPIIEQLAYEYNRELDAQETRQEAVNRWITAVAEATAAGRHCFWLARVEEQITGFISFRHTCYVEYNSWQRQFILVTTPANRPGRSRKRHPLADIRIDRACS
jgi:hypothetical protein